MKKLATIAGTAALFVATVFPALGAGNNCSNSTTGPFSSDYCTINNTSNVTVNNVNDAKIVNNVTARANTGGNSSSYNTLGGSVSTGNATLNATISNVANVNTTTVAGGASLGSNSGANEITGPFSDNRVNINNRQRVDVYNSNTASVDNQINVTANAGDNKADYNTGPASVTAGDAGLVTSLFNHVNDNATGVSVGAGVMSANGNGGSGNSGTNNTTGPFSANYVTLNNTSDVDVNNVNDLKVRNFVRALANTGRNSASYNTLGGDVGTGNAWSDVYVETQGNVNTTTVEVAMGGFDNVGGNSVTGPGADSDNRSTILNNQNVVVDNWNNKCESHNADRLGWKKGREFDGCKPWHLGVFNYDDDLANAGDNNADYNTGPGNSSAGYADLIKTVLTHLNDTLTVIQI